MIGVIAQKELKQWLSTPFLWLYLALFQIIATWLFFIQVDQFMNSQTQLLENNIVLTSTQRIAQPFFVQMGLLSLLFLPFLTMSVVSREYQQKTIILLRSAPITTTAVILGKFVALLLIVLLMSCLLSLTVSMLALGTRIEWLSLLIYGLSYFLQAMTVCAIGLFFSALTQLPIIAGIGTLGFTILLVLVGMGQTNPLSLSSYISLHTHYQALISGVINSHDVAYFIVLTVLFLSWTVYRVASDVWPK